jgi:16S rRNA G966 N2-methylase RsmD
LTTKNVFGGVSHASTNRKLWDQKRPDPKATPQKTHAKQAAKKPPVVVKEEGGGSGGGGGGSDGGSSDGGGSDGGGSDGGESYSEETEDTGNSVPVATVKTSSSKKKGPLRGSSVNDALEALEETKEDSLASIFQGFDDRMDDDSTNRFIIKQDVTKFMSFQEMRFGEHGEHDFATKLLTTFIPKPRRSQGMEAFHFVIIDPPYGEGLNVAHTEEAKFDMGVAAPDLAKIISNLPGMMYDTACGIMYVSPTIAPRCMTALRKQFQVVRLCYMLPSNVPKGPVGSRADVEQKVFQNVLQHIIFFSVNYPDEVNGDVVGPHFFSEEYRNLVSSEAAAKNMTLEERAKDEVDWLGNFWTHADWKLPRFEKPVPDFAKGRPVGSKCAAFEEWLIRKFTKPGEAVLSLFSGTGTTAAAALRAGCVPVCVEIDKAIIASATARLSEVLAELKMAHRNRSAKSSAKSVKKTPAAVRQSPSRNCKTQHVEPEVVATRAAGYVTPVENDEENVEEDSASDESRGSKRRDDSLSSDSDYRNDQVELVTDFHGMSEYLTGEPAFGPRFSSPAFGRRSVRKRRPTPAAAANEEAKQEGVKKPSSKKTKK